MQQDHKQNGFALERCIVIFEIKDLLYDSVSRLVMIP